MQKELKKLTKNYAVRRSLVFISQLLIFAFSGAAAFLLRFDLTIPRQFARYLLVALPIWIIVKGIVFHLTQLNRRGFRYVSVSDFYRLTAANVAGSLVSYALILLLAPSGFPRAIYLIDLILCMLATGGLPVAARIVPLKPRHGALGSIFNAISHNDQGEKNGFVRLIIVLGHFYKANHWRKKS